MAKISFFFPIWAFAQPWPDSKYDLDLKTRPSLDHAKIRNLIVFFFSSETQKKNPKPRAYSASGCSSNADSGSGFRRLFGDRRLVSLWSRYAGTWYRSVTPLVHREERQLLKIGSIFFKVSQFYFHSHFGLTVYRKDTVFRSNFSFILKKRCN